MLRCPTCGGSRFVSDAAQPERPATCLHCSWGEVVGSGQCVAVTQWGRRCSLPAVGYGEAVGDGTLCERHDRKAAWDDIFETFRRRSRFVSYDDGYGEIFARAILDAHLVATQEQITLDYVKAGRKAANRIRRVGLVKPDEFIYFCSREGLIKIGTSTNVAQRMKAISKGSSMPDGMTVGPVELLATMPGGVQMESELHERFAADRIHGTEWFRPSPRLWSLIHRCKRRAAQEAA